MTRTPHSLRVSRRLAAALALTGALAAAGQAMAIPVNDGDPPPPSNSRPTAALTATPNPVVVPPQLVVAPITSNALPRDLGDAVIRLGAPVQFSAAGSTDSDGEIVKYEWDLDGRPGFEKTTTTPRTSARYTATGTTAVRVRVTDDFGATDVQSLNLVAHRAPVARITGKQVAVVGDGLTFTSASTDDNGIASLEWDLDGDGTFERTGPSVSTSFGTVGPHPVVLRATDILGAKSTATLPVRIHRAPTALIVTNPQTPVVNLQTVLDGSRSTDDGTIARYQWDLNGDGTFETDTAAVPRATTTFTAAGPATVGLKVTDADGATDQTTLRLNVSATPVATADSLGPRVRPLATKLRMSRKGRVAVKVACPAGEQICTVRAQLRGLKGSLKGTTLGTARTQLQGGRRATLSIPLTTKAAKAVAKGTVMARVVITGTDAGGNRAVTRTAVTIRR
ncbi:MAG: PKD domain-containing protein [Thermoleophilia bacterium]